MIGQTSGIEKEVFCTAAVAQYTIAKPGADDDTFSTAAAATDDLVGVFQFSTANAGDPVRLMLTGVSRVVAGGAVTRGDRITSDAQGRGVSAAPAAGSNSSVVGIAMASASAAGEIIPVLLGPGQIQG